MFLRDFGFPELLIILVICLLPIGGIVGLVLLIKYLIKNKQ
jgi:hypothetical protein